VVAMVSHTASPVAEIFSVVLWNSICKTLHILYFHSLLPETCK
jgi:hypothetical protein